MQGALGLPPGRGYRLKRERWNTAGAFTWFAPSDTQEWTVFDWLVIGGSQVGAGSSSSPGDSAAAARALRRGLTPGQAVPIVVGANTGLTTSSVTLPGTCLGQYTAGSITVAGSTTPSTGDDNIPKVAAGLFGSATSANVFGPGPMGGLGGRMSSSASVGDIGYVSVEYWTQDPD